jgi:hypothetical protein
MCSKHSTAPGLSQDPHSDRTTPCNCAPELWALPYPGRVRGCHARIWVDFLEPGYPLRFV